jgi:NhaP-type Na+/H+ or K+/H+ antiporter
VDTYPFVLAILGLAVVLAAVLPKIVENAPISTPMIYIAAGMALFSLPIDIDAPRVSDGSDITLAERLTELVVITSLMGAGLKLRRPVSWRGWSSTWRLLGIAMPLTIGGIALLGGAVLGLPIAAAVLLGAVLAPTDPVLASDVQLAGPGEHEEDDADDEVRFALTSEAGLNDGLAFPFTNLAIALAAGGAWFARWAIHDVLIKVAVGVAAGLALGRLVALLAFRSPSPARLASTGQGFVSVGATLIVYGVTELVHGYGFLAVFVAAVTLRQSERDHDYHQALHDFAETLERLASVIFLMLLGGAAIDGALGSLDIPAAVAAIAIVLLLRPAAGLIAFLGSTVDRSDRLTISFFGIRGMGTIYYLAHAVTAERFDQAAEIWAVAILVILLSVAIHGVTASAALRRST